ncbi:MAG: hypothetical protein ACKO7R_00035, partial [Pseudanabaena sp.]
QRFFKRLSQNALLVLVKASRIDFLREVIVKKLQIPLKDLLSLKETCKDEFFKDKIIIPILRNLSSQATLDELLLMRSEPSLRSDETIKSYIEQKVKDASLTKLTSTASRHQDKWLLDLIESELEVKIPAADLENLLSSKSTYKSIDEPKASLVEIFDDFIGKQVKEEIETISLEETVMLMTSYEDSFFADLVESDLEKKISTANLEDLLNAKSTYKSTDEPKPNILKLLTDSITQQVKTASFDDLLNQRRHWDEIADELIEPILRSNVSAIIDRFANSGSFDSAGSNSRLLV